MTMQNPNAAAGLSIVILGRRNTSYAFLQMLKCLREQTETPLEILVVDCNVPGDPYSLSLQEDVQHASDVKLLSLRQVRTQGEVCNAALRACRGAYVCFIDSTDEWYANKAERQMSRMRESDSVVACCCNGYQQTVGHDDMDSRLIYHQPVEDPSRWMTTEQFTLMSQVIWRKAALEKIGGFDPALNTLLTMDAMIRIQTEGKTAMLSEPLFDNVSSASAPTAEDTYKALRHLMYKHYDMLLRSRREYHHYSMRLVRSAADCTLWLNAAIHGVVGVCKSPLYTIRRTVSALFRRVHKALQLGWRRLRVNADAYLICKGVMRMRSSEPAPVEAYVPSGDTDTEMLLDPAEHNAPLSLAGNTKVRSVVIPDHITVIHDGMFAGCKNLEKIVIPATVLRIGAHAFQNCHKLRTVEFREHSRLHTIGAYAFANCRSLTELTLAGSVEQLGAYAFAGCANLALLRFAYSEKGIPVMKQEFPTVLGKIPQALFAGCTSLTDILFPEGSLLTSIGDDAFLGCLKLQSVCFNGSIVSIGNYAFTFCRALESFIMPRVDGVKAIGASAFRCCSSLTHFRLPFALTNIRASCFRDCTMLKYIKIPKKVVYIESRAFTGCRDLDSVIIISSNTKNAPNAFDADVRIDRGQNLSFTE